MGFSHDATKLYEAKQFSPTFFDNASQPGGEKLSVPYRLLKPARIESGKRYPLVLFLARGRRARSTTTKSSSSICRPGWPATKTAARIPAL